MADRFTKHKDTKVVFIYAPPWDTHPDFEECLDAQGTPLPPAIDGDFVVEEPVDKKTKSKSAAGLSELDAALSADAGRGI